MPYRKLVKRFKYKKKRRHYSKYKKFVRIKKIPVDGCSGRERPGRSWGPRLALVGYLAVPFVYMAVARLLRQYTD
jgi:hypothetical protein